MTLFELVSGRAPFGGDSVTEVIASVLQKPPLSLRELCPNLAPGFDSVLARSLEKDRERRYSNVAEFAAAIAPFGPRLSALSVERISDVLGSAPTLAFPPTEGLAPKMEGSPEGVPPQPSPLAASGSAKDFAHDATTAAAVSPSPQVVFQNGGTTARPVSSERTRTSSGNSRHAPRARRWGVMALVVVGLAGAAFMTKRGFEARTAPSGQAPSPSAPSASSVASTFPVTSSSPSASSTPGAVATYEAPPTASTANPRPPVIHASSPPMSPNPPVAKGPASVQPPAPATSCHVVKYFDSEGETRFKKECP